MEKKLINKKFRILILIESRKSHSFQSINKILLWKILTNQILYSIRINRR
jgi:hypothetical protein